MVEVLVEELVAERPRLLSRTDRRALPASSEAGATSSR
jgi:hypothetical protein